MIFNFMLFLIALLINNSFYTTAIVPKPSSYIKPSTVCYLNRPLDIKNNYSSCDILSEAVTRFEKRLELKHLPISEKVVVTCNIDNLNIKIGSGCDEGLGQLWPNASIDESYQVWIEESQISIESFEVWGALHALETILQLVYQGEYSGNVIITGSLMDEPQFGHRGMLIDTARYFLPLNVLEKLLDSMAMVKMNVFHWHITDDQSFPFVSTTCPKLTEKGAYHQLKCIYSDGDVKNLLDYACRRGIRVIPEFDTPAHTLSWGKGYPELLTKCYNGAQPNGKLGPLNPVNPSLYGFLKKFFEEIVRRFHDNYIHLGGNEVDYECWSSNPEITKFMKDEKFDWEKHVYNATLDGYKVIVSGTWNLNDIRCDLDWMRYYSQNIKEFGDTLHLILDLNNKRTV
uniref:beta-N-acetylhexosaminidase n=1 Tax=Trichobilharzia regenti TaxID=157069 RepID=A0AA85JEV2_TRIRE|nr:unnamed protein product [Trichobilharzia regenti]